MDQSDVHSFERLSSFIKRPDNAQKSDSEARTSVIRTAPKPTIGQSHQAPTGSFGSLSHGEVEATIYNHYLLTRTGRVNFKDSPFYILQSAVTPIQELKGIVSISLCCIDLFRFIVSRIRR